eukprot:gene30357-36681_t
MSRDYLKQMMLYSGWLMMDPDVLYFELGAASARIGERINNIHLLIPPPSAGPTASNQFLYWNAFLRGQHLVFRGTKPAPEMKPLPCGHYALSVYDLCLAIIRGSQKMQDYGYIQTLFVYTVVILLITMSVLPLVIKHPRLDNPYLLVLFLTVAYYPTYVYGRAYFFLIYVAILDALRQLNMVRTLHCMLRLTELMMQANVSLGGGGGAGGGSVGKCSDKYAQDRLTAVLSMMECKHISCDRRGGKRASLVQEEGKHADHEHSEAEELEDHEGYCPAFYAETDEANMVGSDGSSRMPGERGLEGASEEDTLLATHVMEDAGTESTSTRLSAALGEGAHIDESSCARYPRITFECPQNVLAWTYARSVIINFGNRFRYRMDIYIICTMLLAVMLMVYSLAKIGSSSDRLNTAKSPFFLQCLLIVTVLIIFLVIHSQVASSVNKELQLHKKTLLARKLRIQSYINRLPRSAGESCKEHLELIMSNIEIAEGSVDGGNELTPFKLFGIEANDALTISVLTTAVSFYSVVFSLIFSATQIAGPAAG